VAELGTSGEGRASVFRTVDAELEATVRRLESIRRELAILAQPGASPEVPTSFSGLVQDLRDNDRALLTIYAQLFSDESMEVLRRTLEAHPNDDLDEAFRDLPEDADDATRQALAEQLAPFIVPGATEHGVTLEPRATTPGQAEAARRAVGHALRALYNPAQVDVLRRAHLLHEADDDGADTGDDAP
jgi:hypothetical protein